MVLADEALPQSEPSLLTHSLTYLCARVRTCFACLRAYVFAWLRELVCLRACLFGVLACLHGRVFVWLRASVLACLRAYVLACLRFYVFI